MFKINRYFQLKTKTLNALCSYVATTTGYLAAGACEHLVLAGAHLRMP